MNLKATNVQKMIKSFAPPIVLNTIKYLRWHFNKWRYPLDWYTVQGGILKGREIYVNNYNLGFKDMIAGTYDSFFYDYLRDIKLDGGTICDVGAHIGFHTLGFAVLVGNHGHVIAFEPNTYNRERLRKMQTRNKDLADKIALSDYALSDTDGQEEFNFSENVENQTSSGGYISGSSTAFSSNVYEREGFQKEFVKTARLDHFVTEQKIDNIRLLKIDVEGAEHKVLLGARKTLHDQSPTLLIEIHSVIAMLNVSELLFEIGYRIELLKAGNSSNCFIAAVPKRDVSK